MKSKKKLIFIIIVLLAFILIFVGILFSKKSKKVVRNDGKNMYEISGKVEEVSGTKNYTNSSLEKEHCIEDICVTNLVFYTNDDEGRIEYVITNKSNSSKSGYIRFVFGKDKIYGYYENLDSMKSIHTRSDFKGISFNEKEDYTLEKVSKKDIGQIVTN